MASPSSKVYVIDVPGNRPRKRAGSAGPRSRPPSGDQIARPDLPGSGRSRPGVRLLSAVLLGPIAAAFWLPTPQRRGRWLGISVACLAIAITLAGRGGPLLSGTVELPGGVRRWVLIVPALTFALGLAWARAFALVAGGRAARFPEDRTWIRRSGVVGGAGLLVPGLGLLLAGGRRAGSAAAVVAPLAAAAVVLIHAPWLWARHAEAAFPGLSRGALEGAFVLAAGVFAASALFWIVQALEGVRRTAPPSPLRSGLVGAGLLASLAALAIGFRPATVAEELDRVSAEWQYAGLRLAPLALSEVAARLDPATPEYLARAADLHAALGRGEDARARRDRLAERARAWAVAADEAGRRSPAATRPMSAGDVVRADAQLAWSGVSALYR